jgi:hypothetical protein
MATGDIIFFDEAKAYMQDGDWASTDDMKLAVLDNTTTPAAADAAPVLGDYTEVTAAGTYTAGGTSLGNWTTMISEAAGTVTYDSATNPTWAQDGSNDVDAWWGLIYNDTTSDQALAFVELGGPVDMSAGALTVTWNASGIATLT